MSARTVPINESTPVISAVGAAGLLLIHVLAKDRPLRDVVDRIRQHVNDAASGTGEPTDEG